MFNFKTFQKSAVGFHLMVMADKRYFVIMQYRMVMLISSFSACPKMSSDPLSAELMTYSYRFTLV